MGFPCTCESDTGYFGPCHGEYPDRTFSDDFEETTVPEAPVNIEDFVKQWREKHGK